MLKRGDAETRRKRDGLCGILFVFLRVSASPCLIPDFRYPLSGPAATVHCVGKPSLSLCTVGVDIGSFILSLRGHTAPGLIQRFQALDYNFVLTGTGENDNNQKGKRRTGTQQYEE